MLEIYQNEDKKNSNEMYLLLVHEEIESKANVNMNKGKRN